MSEKGKVIKFMDTLINTKKKKKFNFNSIYSFGLFGIVFVVNSLV